MVASPSGALWLGQSSGRIISNSSGEFRVLSELDGAIRDLELSPDEARVYAVTEAGSVFSLDARTGALIAIERGGSQPYWALAINPHLDIVAVAERSGNIRFLSSRALDSVRDRPIAGRVKRMKWLDHDTLLYNYNDELHRYRFTDDKVERLVSPCGNTIEDFVWDATFGYLVLITYGTDLILCDLESGEKIYTGADQLDYSKGIVRAFRYCALIQSAQ
jgi:WD40 repeat protein